MIIVRHKVHGHKFILLGTGYGNYLSKQPSFFFGTLAPSEESGENLMVSLSDAKGNIAWCDSKDIEVISVNGKNISQLGEIYDLHTVQN